MSHWYWNLYRNEQKSGYTDKWTEEVASTLMGVTGAFKVDTITTRYSKRLKAYWRFFPDWDIQKVNAFNQKWPKKGIYLSCMSDLYEPKSMLIEHVIVYAEGSIWRQVKFDTFLHLYANVTAMCLLLYFINVYLKLNICWKQEEYVCVCERSNTMLWVNDKENGLCVYICSFYV